MLTIRQDATRRFCKPLVGVATRVATERMLRSRHGSAHGRTLTVRYIRCELKLAGARRERSVRRHRQGCRPAVLKFEEVTVRCVRRRPSRVVLNMTGEADMLDRTVASIGVHRRCFHGCFQKCDDFSSSRLLGRPALSRALEPGVRPRARSIPGQVQSDGVRSPHSVWCNLIGGSRNELIVGSLVRQT